MEAGPSQNPPQSAREVPPPMEAEASGISEPSEAGISEGEAPFVNQGFLKWEEDRRKWLDQKLDSHTSLRRRALSVFAPLIPNNFVSLACRATVTYEMLLSNNTFPRPVPLEDVVELLVDMWETDDYN